MKILLVMDQFYNGNNGTAISAQRFAKGLRDDKNEVRTLSIGKNIDSNYSVIQKSYGIIGNKIIESQGMKLAKPDDKVIIEALKWCDIVHFYMPFSLSIRTMKIAKNMKKPMTAAFHVQPENISYNIGLGKSKKVNDFIYRYFRDRFYNYFKHIHCPSKFIAKKLMEHNYTANLHVISNGVDEDFKVNKKQKPKDLKNKIIITMVGRLSSEKRQDLLIKAVKKSNYENKIQLIFCGKGPKQKELKKEAIGLTNKPIFGFYSKEKLIEILNYTDLYVHTSDAEIEAISCLEAIATGLVPVISNSDESATKQFALDERSLFKNGDSEDLAKKIDYWLSHAKEKKKMEQKYAEMVNQKYRISESINQIEKMFNDEMKRFQ